MKLSRPTPSLPPIFPEPNKTRDDRIARMAAGLAELDRWLDDRLRTGLADPSLASYKTWDGLAARLIDAQVGGLANRVRRLAGLVGAHPDWHSQVLAELGVLHLLATSGRHLGTLPAPLADSVAATIGWQVRQADVLAGVPMTDHWTVMGRSDTREDRIEVRRIWLRGATTGEWAMVLSFAAFQQSLDTSFDVGTQVHADLFRYPGAVALRVLVGPRHGDAQPAGPIVGSSVAERVQTGWSGAHGGALARAISAVRRCCTDTRRRAMAADGFDRVAAARRWGDRWHIARVQRRSTGNGDGRVDAGRPGAAGHSSGRPRRRHRARRRIVVREGVMNAPATSHYFHDVDTRRVLARHGHRRAARHRSARSTRAADGRAGRPGRRRSAADSIAATVATGRRLRGGAACGCVAGGASARRISPPDDDPRPVTPPAATATWRRIVADWPVLEDEWVLAVIQSGRRLRARAGRARACPPSNRRNPPRPRPGRGRAVGNMDDRVVAAAGVRGEEPAGDGGDRRAA